MHGGKTLSFRHGQGTYCWYACVMETQTGQGIRTECETNTLRGKLFSFHYQNAQILTVHGLESVFLENIVMIQNKILTNFQQSKSKSSRPRATATFKMAGNGLWLEHRRKLSIMLNHGNKIQSVRTLGREKTVKLLLGAKAYNSITIHSKKFLIQRLSFQTFLFVA